MKKAALWGAALAALVALQGCAVVKVPPGQVKKKEIPPGQIKKETAPGQMKKK